MGASTVAKTSRPGSSWRNFQPYNPATEFSRFTWFQIHSVLLRTARLPIALSVWSDFRYFLIGDNAILAGPLCLIQRFIGMLEDLIQVFITLFPGRIDANTYRVLDHFGFISNA